MGNPKTKEIPALAAPTIASVFKQRYDSFVRESRKMTANGPPPS